MTAVSKMCILIILDNTVNKYNYKYHKTIKMKPLDVKTNRYIKNNPKFKDGNQLKISKYKIFVTKPVNMLHCGLIL